MGTNATSALITKVQREGGYGHKCHLRSHYQGVEGGRLWAQMPPPLSLPRCRGREVMGTNATSALITKVQREGGYGHKCHLRSHYQGVEGGRLWAQMPPPLPLPRCRGREVMGTNATSALITKVQREGGYGHKCHLRSHYQGVEGGRLWAQMPPPLPLPRCRGREVMGTNATSAPITKVQREGGYGHKCHLRSHYQGVEKARLWAQMPPPLPLPRCRGREVMGKNATSALITN